MAWRWRHTLARILRDAPSCRAPWQISLDALKTEEISVIVLDFDGVLAPWGAERPIPEMVTWMDRCVSSLGVEHVFVLSNGPSRTRKEFFLERYPGVGFVSGVRKKPYPDGLHAILETTQVEPQGVLMVDDRLFTGALAACLAGVKVAYVPCPLVNIWLHPVRELFFMALRGLERCLIRLVR